LLLDRIGDAKVVLLGEATHGTSEFHETRARITRELMEKKGFNIMAIEADWPDVAQVNRYIQGIEAETNPVEKPFKRFPTWMWANAQCADFVESLRSFNLDATRSGGVSLYGLDLYSMHRSIGSVLNYLDDLDPDTAAVARQRYGCLTPWQQNPAACGAATLSGRYRECEPEVVKMLQDLLDKRVAYEFKNEERFLEAVQNARVIKNAEQYYRTMYYGSRESWNLRDGHMFDTLKIVLGFHGPEAKAVVWEHNSHIGNAAATEMGVSGEISMRSSPPVRRIHLVRRNPGGGAADHEDRQRLAGDLPLRGVRGVNRVVRGEHEFKATDCIHVDGRLPVRMHETERE